MVEMVKTVAAQAPETEPVVAVETVKSGFTYSHTRRGVRALAYRGPAGPF